MNIMSIIIIGVILFGAMVGASRGFTKQLVTFVGWIIIIILSFLLKDILANILLSVCHFFNFSGLSALNILLYEGISFLVLVALFSIILGILMRISTMFEKLLKMTIILGIPSKILGAIVGAIEYTCIIFVILYVISSPLFSFKIVQNSKLANTILGKTPVLSNISHKTVEVFTEIKDLKEQYDKKEDKLKLNNEIIDVMVTNNIITSEKVDELVNNHKIVR